MKAAGVVEASCEEVFELVMSMDATRFEWVLNIVNLFVIVFMFHFPSKVLWLLVSALVKL